MGLSSVQSVVKDINLSFTEYAYRLKLNEKRKPPNNDDFHKNHHDIRWYCTCFSLPCSFIWPVPQSINCVQQLYFDHPMLACHCPWIDAPATFTSFLYLVGRQVISGAVPGNFPSGSLPPFKRREGWRLADF